MRIAAIDIGTNSIHMVIARATEGAAFEVVDRERDVVQIGRGSFTGGRLTAVAVRRTVDALARFVDLARRQQVDRILCTATAAVREARNGGEFLQEARRVTGVAPRVIPAEEESRLIYLAVKSALQMSEEPSLIVDIGGGSMQLVVATRDKLVGTWSLPLGALRLTEWLEGSDPLDRRELQKLSRHIRRVAKDTLAEVAELEPQRAYGSSGSIHALAEIANREETGAALDQLNGHVLTLESLDRLTKRLQKMTLAEREKLPGIDQKRAEIIVPGAMVLAHVLTTLDLDALTMSDYGVREGLVRDYLGSHALEVSALSAVEDVRMRSVLQLLRKFQPEDRQVRHARHVAGLALSLFDGLQAEHQFDPDVREVFHYAALLHDVGAVIGYDGHADHSDYIIRNGSLRGLTAEEIQLIATIARYHGKARPKKRDPIVRALDKRQRRVARWLSAILRLAEGLDRSHYQLVRSISVTRRRGRLSLVLGVRPGARLELWSARRRIDDLEKLVGKKIRVVASPETPSARKGADRVPRTTSARARGSERRLEAPRRLKANHPGRVGNGESRVRGRS